MRLKKKRPGTEGSLAPGTMLAAKGLLVAALLSSMLCRAQAPAGTQGTTIIPEPGQNRLPPNTRVIQGVVLDEKGVPIPGAIVILKDTKTLQVRSYIAAHDGTYHFFGLSTDVNYQVRAETESMTSANKLVSVFNSRSHVKVNLKVKNKKRPYSAG